MRALIFAALTAACWASGWLLGKAIHMWRALRRRRRDDLMALADSLKACGAVGRASELGHLWHDCALSADFHTDHTPMHYCRCGVYWRTPAYVSQQISLLEAMLDDPVEPDGRSL